MRCDEMEPLLGPLLDGELEDEETERVRRHLAACAGCRERAAGLAALETAVRGLRPKPSDAGSAVEAVLARARSPVDSPPRRSRSPARPRQPLPRRLLLAATLALAIAGGVWIAVDRPPAPVEPEPPPPATGTMGPGPVECLRPEDCGPAARPLWPPIPI